MTKLIIFCGVGCIRLNMKERLDFLDSLNFLTMTDEEFDEWLEVGRLYRKSLIEDFEEALETAGGTACVIWETKLDYLSN